MRWSKKFTLYLILLTSFVVVQGIEDWRLGKMEQRCTIRSTRLSSATTCCWWREPCWCPNSAKQNRPAAIPMGSSWLKWPPPENSPIFASLWSRWRGNISQQRAGAKDLASPSNTWGNLLVNSPHASYGVPNKFNIFFPFKPVTHISDAKRIHQDTPLARGKLSSSQERPTLAWKTKHICKMMMTHLYGRSASRSVWWENS